MDVKDDDVEWWLMLMVYFLYTSSQESKSGSVFVAETANHTKNHTSNILGDKGG